MIRKIPSRITQAYLDGLSRQGRQGRAVLMEEVEVVQKSGKQLIRVKRKCQFCGRLILLSLTRAVRGQRFCSARCFFYKTPEQRFWEKVKRGKKKECWFWIGGKIPQGYGNFLWKEGLELAHRVSWIIANGFIPDGMDVLHKCDNPPCVNPAHLFIGTATDNAVDMVSKGRNRNGGLEGEDIGNSKLTETDVRRIRRLFTSGDYYYSDLAKIFKVSYQQIRNIVLKKHWDHVL